MTKFQGNAPGVFTITGQASDDSTSSVINDTVDRSDVTDDITNRAMRYGSVDQEAPATFVVSQQGPAVIFGDATSQGQSNLPSQGQGHNMSSGLPDFTLNHRGHERLTLDRTSERTFQREGVYFNDTEALIDDFEVQHLGYENYMQEFPPRSNPFSSVTLSFQDDLDLPAYHCHKPLPEVNSRARNQLIIVSVLCTLFMVAEIIGGVISNSLALLTDAVHMASDLSSFIISIIAITWSTRKPTTTMSFGYHRAEIVGALVSVLLIWVTTGVLVYLAVDRVIHNHYEIQGDEMLITAGLGVAFNIIMGVVLHGGICNCSVPHSHGLGSHGHSHGHGSHGNNGGHGNTDNFVNNNFNQDSVSFILNASGGENNTSNRGKRKHHRNINVRAAFIHVLGDLIQSTGVLIAAYIIRYKPDLKVMDPICTFIFSILVLFTTVNILRDVGRILLEGVPRGFDYTGAKRDLAGLAGVKGVHSLHVWALTMDKNAVTAHLAVGPNTDYEVTVKTATTLLRDKYGAYTSVVQVESYDSAIMQSCDQCKGPKQS